MKILINLPIVIEVLKAEYVENADWLSIGAGLFGPVNGRVNFVHNPNEQTTVYALDECVSHVYGLMLSQRWGDRFARRKNGLCRERNDQVPRRELQQVGHHVDHFFIGYFGCVEVINSRGFVFNIANVQYGREQFEYVPNFLVAKREHFTGRTYVGKLDRVVSSLARYTFALT